ncbi:glutathione S-transferase N-terminal domain-containing protein [Pseudomonas hormoni]|uniref:Glutathione S-transferase N-terminal domain-containing protein n=1 Tax=Pseudomonas hormoni TaxID=3093767 RepID=A0ABX8ERS0_9PSED|nr:glutathione S-transferase N-terminal domain-containing protein [Pseudomonas hormoni]QVW21891.1 glutathione S-transferase N-terminal domain-containing protein [Pseudomonas hormoni]
MTNDPSAVEYYYWPTANGQKVAIFLEESGRPYTIHPVNITKGEQFTTEYTRISPDQRIPALVDSEAGVSVFESGAILLYLAQRRRQFLPQDVKGAAEVLQWLFWQAASLGPILGQTVFFLHYASESSPLAEARFSKETERLYRVLEKQLSERPYVAGEYSIADMAIYPWVVIHGKQGITLSDYPHIVAWMKKVGKRPAVIRAYEKGEDIRPSSHAEEERRKLNGLPPL